MFSEVNHFDICDSAPMDGMHIFLEGIAKVEVGGFEHWICHGSQLNLGVGYWNTCLQLHDWGTHESGVDQMMVSRVCLLMVTQPICVR